MYNFTYSCSFCSLFIEPCCPHADKALPKLPIPHEKLNRSVAKPKNTMDCSCVCSLLRIILVMIFNEITENKRKYVLTHF
jgi:hypothetical protein